MSFSIRAAGSREKVITSLNESVHHRISGEGQIMRGVLLAYMTDVPEEFPDGTPIRYDLTAYGHYQGHSSVPSLYLELKAVTPGELSRSVRKTPRAMIPRAADAPPG